MDLDQYTKYMGNIMKTLHCIVIFDTKCETKQEDLDKVKVYINKLNQNETIKKMIEDKKDSELDEELINDKDKLFVHRVHLERLLNAKTHIQNKGPETPYFMKNKLSIKYFFVQRSALVPSYL